MANWAKLQEQLTGKRVVKRAKHSIHFDNGNGSITANFSGKPCHFQDTDGLWKPIDTGLLLAGDGWYGSPHSDVRIHKDGQVRVFGSDYKQFTKLPSAKKGVLAGDRIIRTFPGGEQHLIITEDGFRQEIHVEKPTFPLEKFIARQTGNLPSKYTANPLTAMDADGNSYVFTGNVKEFGDWLDGAVYPVVIDPDFSASTTPATTYFQGYNEDYATCRSTLQSTKSSTKYIYVYQKLQTNYYTERGVVCFDTSSIGAGGTVTQVTMDLFVSISDDDIGMVKYDWSGGGDTAYDGILASTDVDYTWLKSLSEGIHTSDNLTTSWIDKTGITYYAFRTSKDVSATPPTGGASDFFCSAFHATESYRPVLTVTYTAGSTGALRRTNMNAQMSNLTGGMHG